MSYMSGISLDESEYRDRVYGCWLGKNIGGTLGGPYEGRKEIHSLSYYDPIPERSAPNDDLDLQLVWLQMLLEKGIRPGPDDFAEYWLRHLSPYPWNEYGYCRRNLDLGLRPPVSGCYENYFVDEMGSPIRSEIWACVAPGDPQLAASLAWWDSSLDHTGGEGMYGEMFWAAVESAAFVLDDPRTLIRIGLSMIPVWSRVSRAVREAVNCRATGVDWEAGRERILRCFGHQQPCNAPQNIAFTVLGWLYGGDFGEKLCAAVNCGFDTDCTGATLGALLGILGGRDGIPDRWKEPIGDGVVLHRFTRDLDAPRDLDEFTGRTVQVGARMIGEMSDSVQLSDKADFPGDGLSLLMRNDRALASLERDNMSSIKIRNGYEIALHYRGEPVIWPDLDKRLGVSLRGDVDIRICELSVPDGWRLREIARSKQGCDYVVKATDVEDKNRLGVQAKVNGVDLDLQYVILGPSAVAHSECGRNVPTCPNCHAWIGACLCSKG